MIDEQITVCKGFLDWLLYKAMGDMCGGKFCKNCPFAKENNPYNTDCDKLSFEQRMSMCEQWYRKKGENE